MTNEELLIDACMQEWDAIGKMQCGFLSIKSKTERFALHAMLSRMSKIERIDRDSTRRFDYINSLQQKVNKKNDRRIK